MGRRIWIDAYGSTHGAGKATPMMTDSVPVDRMARPLDQADALLWARLALMRELETSLHGSRKALLALDLPGIERGTNEQPGLIREVEALLKRDTLMAALETRPGQDAKAGLGAVSTCQD